MTIRTLSCAAIVFTMIGRATLGIGADQMTEAVAYFQEGTALFKQKEYKLASMKFRQAYRIKPSWKLFFNIGQSEAAAKRHGLALEAFERFLSEGGDDVVIQRRDLVFNEVERLRKIVGFLRIDAPEGTEIQIDGVNRGTAPIYMLLPVAVGYEHEVSGSLNGHPFPIKRFRVTGGQIMSVDLNESPPSKTIEIIDKGIDFPQKKEQTFEKAIIPDEPLRDRFPFGSVGWISAGVGAAGVVVGAALGGVALRQNKILKKECGNMPCPKKREEKETRNRIATSSTVLLVAGGGVIASGVALILVSHYIKRTHEPSIALFPGTDRSFNAAMGWRF